MNEEAEKTPRRILIEFDYAPNTDEDNLDRFLKAEADIQHLIDRARNEAIDDFVKQLDIRCHNPRRQYPILDIGEIKSLAATLTKQQSKEEI